jgi:hypothetical protein
MDVYHAQQDVILLCPESTPLSNVMDFVEQADIPIYQVLPHYKNVILILSYVPVVGILLLVVLVVVPVQLALMQNSQV